jgi:hypothetical protein
MATALRGDAERALALATLVEHTATDDTLGSAVMHSGSH